MPHKSKIKDTETHFIIDPDVRTIKNTSAGNNIIVQYDHNSERFTFEIPRYVDGHDMFECKANGEVRVNYINSASNGFSKMSGVYVCDDLALSEDDEDVVTFSWLLSSDATQYIGYLYFSIQFVCFDGEKRTYSWNTGVYKDIVIIESININEENGKEYADFLQTWKNDLDASKLVSLVQTKTSTESNGVNEITATYGDGRTAVFQIKNGGRGQTGLVGSIETVDGNPLHFYIGTQEKYNALPDAVKFSGLYAVITDATVFDNTVPLVYLATVEEGSNVLSVDIPNLVLKQGLEILVKSPVSFLNDGDLYYLNLNGIGDKAILTADEVNSSYSTWEAGDILCFKYSYGNGWLLARNLTQHKFYYPDWNPFDIDEYCFETGKTYQVTLVWTNHGRVSFSFFIPDTGTPGYGQFLQRVYRNDSTGTDTDDYWNVTAIADNNGKFRLGGSYRDGGSFGVEYEGGAFNECLYRVVR